MEGIGTNINGLKHIIKMYQKKVFSFGRHVFKPRGKAGL
jgi:hypothetical protein